MENKEYIKSYQYLEEMQEKFAKDFWFMNKEKPDSWNLDFNWADNCIPMQWNNGWLSSFYQLCTELLTEAKSDFEWLQLKEKWGYANCYYTGGITQYGRELIEQFEQETKHICEICGSEGKIRGSGWYKCFCDDCYRELQNQE